MKGFARQREVFNKKGKRGRKESGKSFGEVGSTGVSDSIGKIQAHCLCGKAKVVTVGLNSGIVEIWDLNTGKHLSNLVRHDGFIDCLALSPDGHTLASGSSDTTILLWDLRAATAQKEKAKGKGFSLVP